MKLLMRRCESESYGNITSGTALRGREHFNVQYEEKYSYEASGLGYRVRTHQLLRTLMRDTDVPHFIKIST